MKVKYPILRRVIEDWLDSINTGKMLPPGVNRVDARLIGPYSQLEGRTEVLKEKMTETTIDNIKSISEA